jgi:hypothetical protein
MTPYKLAEIGVDFNTSAPGGLIKASRRFLVGAWGQLATGVPVLMTDEDGNSCVGEVVEVNGLSLIIRPIWETWMSGTARTSLQFSGLAPESFSASIPEPPVTSVATRSTQLTLLPA